MAEKTCGNCLWCWPALECLEQTRERRCYGPNSPRYRRTVKTKDRACEGHETRMQLKDTKYSTDKAGQRNVCVTAGKKKRTGIRYTAKKGL